MQRAEPREASRAGRCRGPQALAGAGDQQLQVVARVGVERGEELVRVDVRQRVLRPGCARSPGIGLPSPGSTSRNMSFRPVLARSSAVASSLIRPLYFGSIWSSTTALPSSSSTLPMSPTRRPPRARSGPGRASRPGRRELDLDGVERLLLDEREAQPLVGEDVAADPDRRGRTAPTIARKSPRCLRIAVLIGRRPLTAPAQLAPSAAPRASRSRALPRDERRAVVQRSPGRRSTKSSTGLSGAGGLIAEPRLWSSTGKARIGPPGACRFGSSCFSHGTSGRCGGGWLPPSGGGRPHRVAGRASRRRGSTGCCRRTGGSRRRGPGSRAGAGCGPSGPSSPPRCRTRGSGSRGPRTARARCSCRPRARAPARRNGTEVLLKADDVRDRLAQHARGPAQLVLRHQEARLLDERQRRRRASRRRMRTPGSASRANARSDGSASLSDAERRLADPQRVAQRRDRGRERHVLARERAGGDVEVRHEVLERALVA